MTSKTKPAMQRSYFALPDEDAPRIGVFWEFFGGGWTLTFDKKQIGTPGSRATLEAGENVQLPDGSTVRVQAILRPIENSTPLPSPQDAPQIATSPTQILVWRNGVALREVRGFVARDNIRQSSLLLFLVGAGDLLLGLSLLSTVGFSRALFTGLMFVLAGWGLRSEARWAASLGLGIAVADLIVSLPRMAQSGFNAQFFLLLVARVLLIVSLQRTMNSLRELQETAPISSQNPNP